MEVNASMEGFNIRQILRAKMLWKQKICSSGGQAIESPIICYTSKQCLGSGRS
ncbi:hypothetical protein HanXRQr2_Chr06g0257381 [Helianthus annuus]|uniref:Uncharacterized protein n=1 Tax=Helianthus annuus TaxID=4232 RepID=A0A251TJ87_HELAN|nr:hypothetical protein HanXRQr2_Chr06g0257381 [Helianthus annuus]KAJ0573428.1 hypothetical protein HanHA89_Chr06g0226651 [Helianthus annuus]KAJ0740693.1 hypothetical protein HanOQP8_Chr06g0219641 [Helianthus annuus]KAJ0915305.1 hypothetical protein HanPSC8_Chr06g0248371 [Helianthus annuus]